MLRVENLSKTFGSLNAVDSVSFHIAPGQIFGLLGPNGAGKTTTISMISGLLAPGSGSIEVDGISVAANPAAAKARLGVVPQEIALYQDLSARQNLAFWGGIYSIRGKELTARIDELLEQVGLRDRDSEPVKNFSGGMKRRLNLAMGIIHKPKLILLDEPTVGIDPQARVKVLAVVEEIVSSGSTVVYTTHYLEEAERLCDSLAIMDGGKILAEGTIDELKRQMGDGSLVSVSGSFSAEQIRTLAATLTELTPLETSDGNAMFLLTKEASVGASLEALFASDLHFDDLSIKEPNLEDLFLKLTGRELRD